MLLDELLQRVVQRLVNYERLRQADIVLSHEASIEAAELAKTAQLANPEHPTAEDIRRAP